MPALFWWGLLAPANGQDAFLARRDAVLAKQPPGVDFRIAAPKTSFYLGEIVPLTLSFSARERGSFVAESRTSDRVGRLNSSDEFVADPAALVEDPLRGLPGETSGLGGISGGPAILGPDKPFTVDRTLNEWVRFRQPGTYRVYVISRRAQQVKETGLSDDELYRYFGGERAELVSNVLTLEILSAPEAWVAQQIAEASAILDAPVKNDQETQRARQRAGLTLRYLNTPESALALAKRLSGPNSVENFTMRMGLLDSHHRAGMLPRLRDLLVAPDQFIPEQFVVTLAQLAAIVESGGVMPPVPEDKAAQPAWQSEFARRQRLTEAKRVEFTEALIRSLPNKRPDVRIRIFDTLLNEAGHTAERPSWVPAIVDALIADFRSLPADRQRYLLENRWTLLRGARMLPLLHDLYNNPTEPGAYQMRDLALRHIYELDPGQGRELILAELRRPDGPRVSSKVVMVLPDDRLPELDEVFVARVAPGWPLPADLIARYATGAIVEQVKAASLAYHAELDRRKLPHCSFPLVFYFLKYDPEFGERELRNELTNGSCYDIGRGLDTLGRRGWSPTLERLAMEYTISNAPVAAKRGAVEALGKYGSAEAQARLWETMENFREWWKDRAELLNKPEGREGYMLEQALVTALGQADAWVLDEEQLRRLLALCTGGSCKGTVQGYLAQAAARSVIASDFGTEIRIALAQYTVIGEDRLAAKLAQFPPGTEFRLPARAPEGVAPVYARVEAAIRAAGHRTVQPY